MLLLEILKVVIDAPLETPVAVVQQMAKFVIFIYLSQASLLCNGGDLQATKLFGEAGSVYQILWQNCFKDATQPTVDSHVEEVFTTTFLMTNIEVFLYKFITITTYRKTVANMKFLNLLHASV